MGIIGMTISEQLLPATEAAKLAGFKHCQSFREFCEREQAMRLVRVSSKRFYVVRSEFTAWLAEKLGGNAD
jgi:hypothetical protein